MIGKFALILAAAAVAVLASPTPAHNFPGGDEESIIIVPVDLHHPTGAPQPPTPAHESDEQESHEEEDQDRTFAFLYTSCASTLNCSSTSYYCGYDLLAGYRCFPKKCIGFCSSASQCLSGACTLNLCQSCIG